MKPVTPKERVRCRPIAEGDLDAVAVLLAEGFRGRSRQAFRAGLERLTHRDVPTSAQRYGYCLDTGSRIVGAIVLIASARTVDGKPTIFCNVSSWYVIPDFRAYAQLLVSVALRNKDFTYTNVTPAPHTWDIVERQGYTRYCSGLFFAAAILAKPRAGAVIERFGKPDHSALPDFGMLKRHHDLGCDVVAAREGERLSGFVFRRYRIRSGRLALPAMFVLHTPDREQLVALSGNFGRYFMRKAAPFLVMDADGPVPGLTGVYTERRGRKYYRGPHRPALCDLADTEYAVFGV